MDAPEKKRVLKELGDIPEDIYDDIVREFIAQAARHLANLKIFFKKKDRTGMAEIVHTVKGSAANLRLYRIAELARDAEVLLESGKDIAPLPVFFESFGSCLADLEKEFSSKKK